MPPLQELFESNAVVKILDFLSLYKDFEYTKTDIANETGISRRTLYQVFPTLEKYGLVIVNKSFGNIKLYKLNTENSICRALVTLANEIALYKAEQSTGISLTTQNDKCIPKATATIMAFVKVEGNSSQIKKITDSILNQSNIGTTIPVAGSTENSPTKISKDMIYDLMKKVVGEQN